MIERENVEVKVGIFVFIGMLILFVIVFSIGDFYFWNPGYSIKAAFKFVNGVEVSAPVRFAGVDAGEVEGILLAPDSETGQTIVELLLWIRQYVRIPQDSVVTINTLGLLGEKYVEITPGSPQVPVLKEGDQIRGRDPLATEAIAVRAYQVASKMDQAMEHINSVVKDAQFKESFKQTVVNASQMTDSANDILAQIKSGEGTLGKLIYSEELHNDLEELTDDLKANPWKLLHKPKEKKGK